MTHERPEPACLGREDLMCSVNLEHHEQARRLCLGDARHGVPACPMLAECQQMVRDFRETQWQSGLHGTWAGVRYGKKLAAAEAREELKGRAKPREHGSERGYQQHRHRKEKVCVECMAAHYVTLDERFGVAG